MHRTLAFLCFFASGFAGLVYEIAWIRRASLVFGSTTEALSTVLAVFFGGLALGSWLFGRLGLRTERPIRWYALLEFGLAGAALASPWLFGLVDGMYGAAWRGALTTTTDAAGLTWLRAGSLLPAVRVALVALVLLVPTTLMGGTLPLFVRQFTVSRERLGASIGFLYGLNTLGAAAGALAAGLVLLPWLGVGGAIALAAALNVGAGALALALPFRADAVPPGAPASPLAADAPPRALRRALPALFFVAGFMAIGAEVLWARFLALVIRNSITTYTLTLGVVLVGIVLGSLLAGRLSDRPRLLGLERAAWYGVLQLAAGIALAVLMFLPVAWWRGLGEGLTPIALLMLPAAVFSGSLFPLANRLVVDDPARSARGVGRMTALNTLGGIAGSLVVGFGVLPHLGLDAGVRVLTVLALLAGGVAHWLAGGRSARRLAVIAVAGGVALGVPAATGVRLPRAYLEASGRLVDVAEGRGSTLSAVRAEDELQLRIDRLWQGSDRKNHQIMAAHLPALLHGDPQDVLVIGVGVGQTAGRFLMHGVDRLDCVDIEPAVFPFIARNFPAAWLRDERVTLVPEDGRTFTAHTDRRYDIVSVEVGQIFRPGVDVFYTREFYREAAALLKPGGLVAQFVSLAFFGEAEFTAVVHTFLEVFPHAQLWYNTQELLLIGSPSTPPRLDPDLLAAGGLPDQVAADLDWSQWGGVEQRLARPGALLGGFLVGGEDLVSMTNEGAVYTDGRPVLAYATAGVRAREHREERLVPRLRQALSPFVVAVGDTSALAPAVLAQAHRVRDLNLRDILATGYLDDAVAGAVHGSEDPATPQQILSQLQQVVRINPQNFHGWYNGGKALLLMRQPEPAIEPLRRAAQLRPDNALARRDLGLALLQSGRTADSLPDLRAAVELNPDDPAAHNYLGAALSASGDLQGAIRHFERSLALAPGDAAVRQNLDRARRRLNSGGR